VQALIVAADQEDRDFISFALRYVGFSVAAQREAEGLQTLLSHRPVDLVVIADGDEGLLERLVRQVRAVVQTPVLLVTRPLSDVAHCTLLDAGADLVFDRPASPRLLSRYARVLLRRAANVPSSILPVLTGPHIALDPDTRSVTVGSGVAQRLTQLEFRLLYMFMTNPGQVLPLNDIVARVWGYEGDGNRDLVRGLVRRLRRKIEPHAHEPRFIVNIPAVGYRFSPDP